MKPNIKKIIIIVCLIIALGVAYKVFFASPTPVKSTSALSSSKTATTAKPTTTTTAKTTATTATAKKVDKDTEFLSTLLNISKINVDATIFASPSFNSLQDNNVPIANDETAGRENPFAPLDTIKDPTLVEIAPVTTTQASLVTTTSAVLAGSISSDAKAQSRFFEWGTTEALGKMTALADESLVGTFTKTVTGLTPKTKYYFRAVIKVGTTNVSGDIVSFTTN